MTDDSGDSSTTLKDQLTHIVFPVRSKKRRTVEDQDIYTIDPFDRMENAVRKESEKKSVSI